MVTFKELKSHAEMKVVIAFLLALLVPIAGTIMTDAPAIWPLSTLLYSFGLLYSFSLFSKSVIKVIAYNMIATIFFVVEASFFFSYYLQNSGFNDAFYYHLRSDLLYAGVREQLPTLILMLVCLIGFLFMSSCSLVKNRSNSARLIPFTLGLLAVGLFISPPAKALLLNFKNLSTANKDHTYFVNFTDLLNTKLTAEFSKSKKNNVIMIYAESLEQRYFDETIFPGLVPNLKRIKAQSIDFSNVSQGVNAGWTIAGMVASQCGYPLVGSYGITGNNLSLFGDFLPKANCLGDLLEKDGYRLAFMGGSDARFAGKADFLRAHGYSEIYSRDDFLRTLVDKTYANEWGVFDDTLFDSAIRKFITLSSNESPFLLSLLTLDTHNPNGFLSKSCSNYGAGENSSLNSVHCSDHLISRFIEQIRNSPYSANTIIIVLSDHLALENQSSDLLADSQMPSRLTFFVNSHDSNNEVNTNSGLTYDIAPTILDLLGFKISGQMGFGAPLTKGRGYLHNKFGDQWIKQSENLKGIASTLWNNNMSLDKDGITFNAYSRFLSMGGRKFNLTSEGYSRIPSSALFIFDDKSLNLEKILIYPFDEGVTPETLSKELIQNKDKLALVISTANNLSGFIDPSNNSNQEVFFFGKPGSDLFSTGPIRQGFKIPFETIRDLGRSQARR